MTPLERTIALHAIIALITGIVCIVSIVMSLHHSLWWIVAGAASGTVCCFILDELGRILKYKKWREDNSRF